MNIRSSIAAAVALVALALPAMAAETLESVEKKIGERIGSYKSLSFKSSSKSEMKDGDVTMTIQADSSVAYARRGNAWVSRVESKNNMSRHAKEGKPEKQESEILTITGGDQAFMLTSGGGQKMAMKSRMDPKTTPSPFDAQAMFKMQHEDFNAKLVGQEKLDGKPVWVIELTPKNGDSGKKGDSGDKRTDDDSVEEAEPTLGRAVTYYDQATGVAVKSLSYDSKGKLVTTLTVTDIKVNADFPPDHFTFRPPPGVQVIDYSQPPQTQPPRPHPPPPERGRAPDE